LLDFQNIAASLDRRLWAPSGPPEWYAVHTRSNFERRIAAELAGKGIEAYLPAYAEVHQWKDRKQRVEIPLFPGYLFARFSDSPQSRLAVLQARGVARILGDAGAIEPVPSEQIEAVERMLASSARCCAHPYLREGARVRVRRGALANLEGILVRVKNEARLVISIPLLSQAAAVEIDIRNVEFLGDGKPGHVSPLSGK
jgi:transcription antitermination factor NusG